jgi:protein-tyrosine phosphatase
MAAGLMSKLLAERGVPAEVASAGLLPGDRCPPPELIATMAARGIDVGDHRSRELTPEMVACADLIVAMAREHLREVVRLVPEAWGYTFTLKELARRAQTVGPRGRRESLGDWLGRIQAGRVRQALLGSSPTDDVADPVGGPRSAFEAAATDVERLVAALVAQCWPE